MTTASDMSSRLLEVLAERPAAWRFIASFAADWRSPLEPGDGHDASELDAADARLGVKLPTALREAYALFGRRDDLTRNQDELLTPSELHIYQGALVYQAENQGAWSSAAPPRPHYARAPGLCRQQPHPNRDPLRHDQTTNTPKPPEPPSTRASNEEITEPSWASSRIVTEVEQAGEVVGTQSLFRVGFLRLLIDPYAFGAQHLEDIAAVFTRPAEVLSHPAH